MVLRATLVLIIGSEDKMKIYFHFVRANQSYFYIINKKTLCPVVKLQRNKKAIGPLFIYYNKELLMFNYITENHIINI